MTNEPHFDPSVPISDIEVPETPGTIDLVPKMAESITECGLLNPITITPIIGGDLDESSSAKYKLVAGWARLKAASHNLWKTIPARIVSGDSTYLASIAAQESLVRRKLSCLDEALMLGQWQSAYEQKYPETKKGGDTTKKNELSANLTFCKYASERTPYGERTIQRLVHIAKELDPKAVEMLKLAAGSSEKPNKMADHQASLELLVGEFKHNKELQEQAVVKAKGNPKKLRLAIEELRREELKEHTCDWANENIELKEGDFREVGKDIANQTVGLILTDPPWPKQYIPLGKPLGEFADRVLKPGGALVMMLGQATQLPFLEGVRTQLTDDKYSWWEFAYLYKDSKATIVQHVKVASMWKPIWVAIKWGKNSRQVIPDLINETRGTITGGGKEKTYDEWGQSPDGFETLINYLTQPGDLVVDPFVGGGATAVAALRTARKFIGIDIDPDCIKMTRLHLEAEDRKDQSTKADSLPGIPFGLPIDPVPPTVEPADEGDQAAEVDADVGLDVPHHAGETQAADEGLDTAA